MGQDAKPPDDPVLNGIPRGIEVLVKKASVDAAFRSLLLERPEEAAARIALELDAVERLMLRAAPREQLETIIARATVPEEHRRAFLGHVAAAMVAVVGLAAGPVEAGAYDGVYGVGGLVPLPAEPAGDANIPEQDEKPGKAKPGKPKPADNAERVKDVIADQLKVKRETVTPEKSLVKDLGAKPTEMARLRRALAKEFQVQIPASAFGHAHTVGEAIACVEKALAKQSPPMGWSGGTRP
jgi:acyl carrier protein